MKLIKKSAIALALSAVSFGAFAMTSIDDAALSQVSGQDGVSIAADLNINIGKFTYTDKASTTDASGNVTDQSGSVSFNNIGIRGAFIMTIDVLNAAQFNSSVVGALMATDYYNLSQGAATALALATSNALQRPTTAGEGGDVVQFAFPKVTGQEAAARAASMSITVDSITTGNGGASFGSVAIKNFDLQGTKVWMFGH